jgi:hypothetical protein
MLCFADGRMTAPPAGTRVASRRGGSAQLVLAKLAVVAYCSGRAPDRRIEHGWHSASARAATALRVERVRGEGGREEERCSRAGL